METIFLEKRTIHASSSHSQLNLWLSLTFEVRKVLEIQLQQQQQQSKELHLQELWERMTLYDFITFIPANYEFNQLDLQWFLDSFSCSAFLIFPVEFTLSSPLSLGIWWIEDGKFIIIFIGFNTRTIVQLPRRQSQEFLGQSRFKMRQAVLASRSNLNSLEFFFVQLWLWIYISVGWHLRWVAWQSALLQPRHGSGGRCNIVVVVITFSWGFAFVLVGVECLHDVYACMVILRASFFFQGEHRLWGWLSVVSFHPSDFHT